MSFMSLNRIWNNMQRGKIYQFWNRIWWILVKIITVLWRMRTILKGLMLYLVIWMGNWKTGLRWDRWNSCKINFMRNRKHLINHLRILWHSWQRHRGLLKMNWRLMSKILNKLMLNWRKSLMLLMDRGFGAILQDSQNTKTSRTSTWSASHSYKNFKINWMISA